MGPSSHFSNEAANSFLHSKTRRRKYFQVQQRAMFLWRCLGLFSNDEIDFTNVSPGWHWSAFLNNMLTIRSV
eukprot:scaffold38482_cov20-Prasinocladus_malaysianus.AAC.1